MTPRIVVGAAILDGTRLLAAQRSQPPALAGRWEFPGGKVEPGESEQAALVREVAEELGVAVAVGQRVGADVELRPGLVLRVWVATLLSGEPRPLEDHSALRWLAADEWYDVPWLTADLPVVHALRELLGLS